MDYAIVEQKEILHEAFAGLLASLYNLKRSGQLNELEHGNNFLLEASNIWNRMLTDDYSTMEDISKIKGRYIYIKSHIDKIGEFNG